MLDLGYVDTVVGGPFGLLEAITSVLGGLARTNPEQYLGKLRSVLWIDVALGCLLAGAGLIIWFGSATAYGYDLVEILFWAGALMLGILGMVAGEFLDSRFRVRRFVHVLLVAGLIFLALGAYPHFTGVASGRSFWGILGRATFSGLYVVFIFVSKTNIDCQAERVS